MSCCNVGSRFLLSPKLQQTEWTVSVLWHPVGIRVGSLHIIQHISAQISDVTIEMQRSVPDKLRGCWLVLWQVSAVVQAIPLDDHRRSLVKQSQLIVDYYYHQQSHLSPLVRVHESDELVVVSAGEAGQGVPHHHDRQVLLGVRNIDINAW